ncbi:MAG: antirestriction protein ArdA [Paludibacteraceae bacterium]|nr:antirestriction protein ArdA [Paludibacteraceae bacterium]
MINIAITNLGKYNEGELIFEWVTLPCDDFTEVFELIGNPEEYFISDYECEDLDIEINEYSNLEKLNEFAEKLDSLKSYELKVLKAIAEAESEISLEEVFEIYEKEDYIFYNEKTIEDLAYTLVDHGYFGEVPEEIERYIDYDKFARDLYHSGYIETSHGIIYFY